MRPVYIVGAGMTKFGRSELSLADLMTEASLAAIHDADLGDARIDGVVVANMGAARLNQQTAIASALVDRLSLSCDRGDGGERPGIRGIGVQGRPSGDRIRDGRYRPCDRCREDARCQQPRSDRLRGEPHPSAGRVHLRGYPPLPRRDVRPALHGALRGDPRGPRPGGDQEPRKRAP